MNDPAHKAAVGTGRRVAYALAAIDLEVVQRSTIRSLLPVGTSRRKTVSAKLAARERGDLSGWAGDNRISGEFQKALRRYEEWCWIQRGKLFVRVLDRQALHGHALDGLPEGVGTTYWLDIERAAADIKGQLAKPALDVPALAEQRWTELRAIQRLMEGRRGDNWSGRGSARFAVHGETI